MTNNNQTTGNNSDLPKHILALTGSAGSGKSTIADHIASENNSDTESFAIYIKQAVNQAICENKNAAEVITKAGFEIQDNGLLSDADFEDLKNDTSIEIPMDSKTQMPVRSILQQLGTEILRELDVNFHVKMLANRILANQGAGADLLIMSDARFSNELMFVQQYNKAIDKSLFLESVARVDVDDSKIAKGVARNTYKVFGSSDIGQAMAIKVIKDYINLQADENSRPVADYDLDGEQPEIKPTLSENIETGLLPITSDKSISDQRLAGELNQHASEDFSKSIDEYVFEHPQAGYMNPYKPTNTVEQNSLYADENMTSVLKQVGDIVEQGGVVKRQAYDYTQDMEYQQSYLSSMAM